MNPLGIKGHYICKTIFSLIKSDVQTFFRKFNEKVILTKEEEDLVKKYLTPKKLSKKHYLVKEGNICKHISVVEKGALKSYVLDEMGKERITAFALEGWTIADLFRYALKLILKPFTKLILVC